MSIWDDILKAAGAASIAVGNALANEEAGSSNQQNITEGNPVTSRSMGGTPVLLVVGVIVLFLFMRKR